MRYVMVSVYDKAVDAYGRPWFARSEGEAIRIFSDEVNRKAEDNMLSKHTDDYSLYVVAEWDDETATTAPKAPPARLIEAGKVKLE